MDDRKTAWDEFQWEAHLRRLDRASDRLMEVRFCRPPGLAGVLPPMPRWSSNDAASEEDEFPDEDLFTAVPRCIVEAAGECVRSAFQMAPPPLHRSRDATLIVEFLADTTAMAAHLAAAVSAEDDGEELGRGVALAKRSLAAANSALEGLFEIRTGCRRAELLEMALELTELRNQIAIYVVDLRDRFRLGPGG